MALPTEKSAFPAKAGIHLSGDGAVEEWVPAFAGSADFFGIIFLRAERAPVRRSGSARNDTGKVPGYAPSPAASARARAQKSATDSSSARAVGTMPARASRGSTGTPSVLRLERSILRRWPKAAAVTRSRTGFAAGASATGRGVRRTTLDVTFGGGTKARGGRSKRIFGSVSHCTTTERRP